ncbi:hypothetical protein [Burkholderia perseverans]|uniref:hypothetical protein n=1 Tax=Burkholderia perseverans TaxID=2615214 RepID=UPI001FF05AB3|nr:hypothetical protein [Burkholderia perseverans]
MGATKPARSRHVTHACNVIVREAALAAPRIAHRRRASAAGVAAKTAARAHLATRIVNRHAPRLSSDHGFRPTCRQPSFCYRRAARHRAADRPPRGGTRLDRPFIITRMISTASKNGIETISSHDFHLAVEFPSW